MALSLKRLFNNFHPEPEQVADGIVNNHAKIVEVLGLLKQEDAKLKINFAGSKKDFSSHIIAVDKKNLCFTLDEIFPEDAHLLFSRSGNLIAQSKVQGATVSFQSSLIRASRSRQFTTYVCDIPDSISYIQRRNEYRVLVPSAHLVRAVAQHAPSRQILQGRVHDISLNGICLAFKSRHIIKPGEQLTHCKLPVGSDQVITFTLEVRHIESNSTDTIHVGGKFSDLTARSSELISRFVRELERIAIRG